MVKKIEYFKGFKGIIYYNNILTEFNIEIKLEFPVYICV